MGRWRTSLHLGPACLQTLNNHFDSFCFCFMLHAALPLSQWGVILMHILRHTHAHIHIYMHSDHRPLPIPQPSGLASLPCETFLALWEELGTFSLVRCWVWDSSHICAVLHPFVSVVLTSLCAAKRAGALPCSLSAPGMWQETYYSEFNTCQMDRWVDGWTVD